MPVQPRENCFTVDEYHQLVERGFLSEDSPVELIEGEVVRMSPIGSRHAGVVNRSTMYLNRLLADVVVVSVQNPIRLSDVSEPQPDISLLRPREDFYSDSHPGPGDVLVVIEVADESLRFDRKVKLPLYARAGIPQVWLIDLQKNVVEIHSKPRSGRYQMSVSLKRGDGLVIPELADFSFKVENLLG
ncbi:MAG TPA: Uma2 family endonuclease [Blastocatellia bacterium]|nr:Uma2 family endonuclease [Blastocatellia bacterium]